jgi:hypothetical protein
MNETGPGGFVRGRRSAAGLRIRTGCHFFSPVKTYWVEKLRPAGA